MKAPFGHIIEEQHSICRDSLNVWSARPYLFNAKILKNYGSFSKNWQIHPKTKVDGLSLPNNRNKYKCPIVITVEDARFALTIEPWEKEKKPKKKQKEKIENVPQKRGPYPSD